jgi:predicted RNase H-like nuclease (RuvC/YqgF family)
LTAFSQIDTSKSNEVKCLPVPVIKNVIKDLISGDSAKAQLELTEQELILNEKKIELKDTIISKMRDKERDYKKIIDNQEAKFGTLLGYTEQLQKNIQKLNSEIKVLRTKNKIQGIVIGSGLTIAIGYAAVWYFLIK